MKTTLTLHCNIAWLCVTFHYATLHKGTFRDIALHIALHYIH